MTLTSLQRERISFHLDYTASRYLLAVSRDILVLTLNADQELALIGQDLIGLDPDEIFEFHGVPLCTNQSALGKVERAFNKLSSDIIEESLYVAEAGSVKLRANELAKREALYLKQVEHLAQLIGGTFGSDRVGRLG